MGCSPREYREQFFLRQGKKMLLNTDLSLENIAEACHMCDRYYISKRFKRLFGVSPWAFRKNAGRENMFHETIPDLYGRGISNWTSLSGSQIKTADSILVFTFVPETLRRKTIFPAEGPTEGKWIGKTALTADIGDFTICETQEFGSILQTKRANQHSRR